MRRALCFCFLAVMVFLLVACSMQSPEADPSAVDVSTESVSNNAAQSGVLKEPDELPAKDEENKEENPETDAQMTTQPGDIVLYSGNQLVIFFGSNSWSYTKLGHIEGFSTDELTALLNKDIAVIEIKNG
jgi:hypothetical protein